MADEIARTEVEVWRLAHKVGGEFIEMMNKPGVPRHFVDGATAYREYISRVLAAAGYPIVGDSAPSLPPGEHVNCVHELGHVDPEIEQICSPAAPNPPAVDRD